MMSRKSFQRGTFIQPGLHSNRTGDARQKLIRGRIQDARQILNKKAQMKNAYRGKSRNASNGLRGLAGNKAKFFRLQQNRNNYIGKIRNRKMAVSDNVRAKLKNDIVVQRGRLVANTRGKQIKMRGGSIQVTAKQLASPQALEPNDELEEMTLSDLPDFTSRVAVPSAPSRAVAPPVQMLMAAPVAPVASTHTVLVSNLHPTVTEDDIKELFGAVGTIGSTRFMHPGVALVSYFSKEEAISACNSYHNRLLDSQPMQCSVLSQESKARASIASRLGGRLASENSVHNFARVALSQYMPAPVNQRGMRASARDPIFSVRLS